LKITEVAPFLLHVPVTGGGIADSTHEITHWGMPGCRIITDTGLVGFGYTGTHAAASLDRLITSCISDVYAPLLLNEDPREVRSLHCKLLFDPPSHWVGRGGITQMALSAVDIALWDLKAKAMGEPLWHLLGGSATKLVEAYNTDCGWLNLSNEKLVDGCRYMIEEEGFAAVKMKVGKPDPKEDLERVEAVRSAIGSKPRLMVDANAKWNLPMAIQYGSRFADFDVTWFEEPLWHDDVRGHACLAKAIDTPLALGELLYNRDQFREFVTAEAVHYLQPDASRCGGITGLWEIADLGLAHNIPVSPHHGDMMQAQLHAVIAHSGCSQLEFIPWTLHCFEEPVCVKDGRYRIPEQPGAGTTITPDSFEKYGISL
jgi:L-alanine-DL-glutamate epimerase-like enolase superfamily enzyme